MGVISGKNKYLSKHTKNKVSIVSGITKSSRKHLDQNSDFSTTDQVSRDAKPQLFFDCESEDSVSIQRVQEEQPNPFYE